MIKAAGLAAGKGVMICSTLAEAEEAITRVMVNREFGDAGDTLLIEEMLSGPEVSILALTDGNSCWILDPAQDHKRVGEGDTGPNTGGMGRIARRRSWMKNKWPPWNVTSWCPSWTP